MWAFTQTDNYMLKLVEVFIKSIMGKCLIIYVFLSVVKLRFICKSFKKNAKIFGFFFN